jgi:uncharacterized protein (DUF488 family)
MDNSQTVYTIGHSSRSAEALVALLQAHEVQRVIDVRRYPQSKRFPQFNSGNLAATLAAWKIGYEHEEALGGRRPARSGSDNTAWRDEGFRGYADYMESREFQRALQGLVERSAFECCAILCAEAAPKQCHRQLIADALITLNVPVCHILDDGTWEAHTLDSCAVVVTAGLLRYPAPQQELDLSGG